MQIFSEKILIILMILSNGIDETQHKVIKYQQFHLNINQQF